MIHNVIVHGEASEKEIEAYKEHVSKKYPQCNYLEITIDGEDVDLKYYIPEVKFSRLRRITGYLTSSLERWNDAKQAEEHDRVKHSI